MLDKPLQWLRRKWWGLIVAYLILVCSVYVFIWQFAEPLGIPENIEVLPGFVKSRVFIHLTLTLLLAAYITLILDLAVRRKITSISQSDTIEINKCDNTDYCTVRIIQSDDELNSVFRFPGDPDKSEYLDALAKSGCLLEGHFRLVSGKHSARFIRFRKILENPDSRDYFARKIAGLVGNIHFSRIIGPSGTAGGILANEVARVLGMRAMTFPVEYGKRMLTIPNARAKELFGEQCLYIDDLTTTGGGVISAVENLREKNILVVGVAVAFVRNEHAAEVVQKRLNEKGTEFFFLGYADLTDVTWDETDCKLCQLIYSQDLN